MLYIKKFDHDYYIQLQDYNYRLQCVQEIDEETSRSVGKLIILTNLARRISKFIFHQIDNEHQTINSLLIYKQF